jgi:hypothetical protein
MATSTTSHTEKLQPLQGEESQDHWHNSGGGPLAGPQATHRRGPKLHPRAAKLPEVAQAGATTEPSDLERKDIFGAGSRRANPDQTKVASQRPRSGGTDEPLGRPRQRAKGASNCRGILMTVAIRMAYRRGSSENSDGSGSRLGK